MGASSRPDFKAKTATEADDFFVDSMEKWRIAMGNMSGFILAGHSFGGYICGHYAVRYPQHIIKLILLSPVGIKSMETYNKEQEKLKEHPEY